MLAMMDSDGHSMEPKIGTDLLFLSKIVVVDQFLPVKAANDIFDGVFSLDITFL